MLLLAVLADKSQVFGWTLVSDPLSSSSHGAVWPMIASSWQRADAYLCFHDGTAQMVWGFFSFSLSEDELIIDFDGRFCLKINAAFSHLTKWSTLPPLLLKGKETCRAVGVWHSFDGSHTLALNYSIWDAEMELSLQSQGFSRRLIVCSKIHPLESCCDRCRYLWKLLADFHGTVYPRCTELLRSLLSEVLMVWKRSELRVKLFCVSGSLPGDCET